MSSLVRTLEKRILKTLGLYRQKQRFEINPVTNRPEVVAIPKNQRPIMSGDNEINYGTKWPQLVRLPGMSTRPQFAAMPRSPANLA